MQRIVALIAQDEQLADTICMALESIGGLLCTNICPSDRCLESLESLESLDKIPLIILHVPNGCGDTKTITLVREIRRRHPACIVFVILEERRSSLEFDLYRAGVLECFIRPLDIRRITMFIELATLRARCELPLSEPEEMVEPVESLGNDGTYLYCSDAMKNLVRQTRAAGKTRATILLTGETGTGKTMLAKVIHELSPWNDQPFAVINCGTMTSTLVESELFGHTKGAFTGADSDREGKLATAGRGTLMIDEIDSLPLTAQSRLLRAVDERAFEKIGSNKTMPVDARLVVATNRSLEDEVKAGRFRSDLYYRVNVVSLHLPSLRERRRLIEPLAAKFVDDFAKRYDRRTNSIDPRALAVLRKYDWPGNIRQLRNVIERAIATSDIETIGLEQLPDELRACRHNGVGRDRSERQRPPESGGLAATRGLGADAIREALDNNRNNRARTAKELGISRVTLYKKLHKYGFI